MGFLKPVARSVSGLCSIAAAFWGVFVTDDLLLLFGVIAFAGVAQFLIGLSEERDLKEARKLAAEDRQAAAEDRALRIKTQEFMEKYVPSSKIPVHLRNLNGLSNAEIKSLVAKTTARLREWALANVKFHNDILSVFPEWASMPKGERDALWLRHNDDETKASLLLQSKFCNEQRPDALAIWKELKARVPNENHPQWGPTAIEDGMLAGVNPVETTATEIENLARHLDD